MVKLETVEFVMNIGVAHLTWQLITKPHEHPTAVLAVQKLIEILGIEGLENFLSYSRETDENVVIGVSAWYGVSHSVHFSFHDEDIRSRKEDRDIDIFVDQLCVCLDGFLYVHDEEDGLEVN